MNVLFAAQGSILKVFHDIDVMLRSKGIIKKSAYWVADSEYYNQSLSGLTLFHESEVSILKEWDFTSLESEDIPENWQELEQKYELVGEVWNAIVADRRLMHGRLCKMKQSYQGHFSHEQLLSVIYGSLAKIDSLIAELKPDRIVTFVPATYGDILLEHAAKVHDIDYRVLRVTKIKNFVAFSDRLGSCSSWMEKRYKDNLEGIENHRYYGEAIDFLDKARSAPIEYEGSIESKKKSFSGLALRYFKGAAGALLQHIRRRRYGVLQDNHLPPAFGAFLHGNLLRELKESKTRKLMAARQWSLVYAKTQSYVFYPMHCEPEVAMSVYGREHQNQIETIRRIAQSIPLSWKVVVKEHPRSIAYRSPSYFKKLLGIPNLVFADPDTKPFFWNQHAKAVITVSGFAGFEAAMVKVPVIVLGDASFSLLPQSMLRTVKNMEMLAAELKSLLANYKCEEHFLVAYIMANMQVGVDVNLYSELLAKSGRVTMDSSDRDTQLVRLANWIETDFQEQSTFDGQVK